MILFFIFSGIKFSQSYSTVWGSNKSKRVQVRDKDKLGTLYEILPTLRIKQSVDRNSRSEVMGQLND